MQISFQTFSDPLQVTLGFPGAFPQGGNISAARLAKLLKQTLQKFFGVPISFLTFSDPLQVALGLPWGFPREAMSLLLGNPSS